MSALLLSRFQFAFTIGFHILWPTFSIGVASFVAFLSGAWWWAERPVFRALMRFWIEIFAVGFGMGVVTGVVLSYEIGTNWSGFSRSVSNVLGPMFAYEVLTAFFLEAGFIGIVLFGEKRVGRGTHFFACCMVAVGTLLSATWILAANSWMQTPAGYTIDRDGIFHVADWWEAVFNPSFPFRFMHMVCASYLTGSLVVAAVSAFHLWRRAHLDTARVAFSLAMWAIMVLTPLQIALGDLHGLNTRKYQPTKIAAMEGLWESGRGVSATGVGWPDITDERNRFAIEIPHLASVYLTHSWNGYVQGLKAVPAVDRPYVPIVFFAFRVMVAIGIALLGVATTGAVLRWRGRLYTTRWFQLVSMTTMPLGFVAVLAGWTTTEAGRQPFVVYRLLRTANSASALASPAVGFSLLCFITIYSTLVLVVLWHVRRIVIRGPELTDAHSGRQRPGIGRAAPSLVGGPPAASQTLSAAE